MKYTLIAEDTWDHSKTTREFEVDALPEVLSEVQLFLKGVGFVFDGTLDFVNDFDDTPNYDEEDYQETETYYVGEMSEDLPSNNWPFATNEPSPKTFGHSHHYFDIERNK